MVFKWWQIILFSLLPLALVFAGVIGGSFHGVDSAKESFPTAAPQPTSGPGTVVASAPAGTPGAGGGTTLAITAKNLSFNPRSLTAPANSKVTVVLDNQDASVQHNFAVYKTKAATDKIFVGDLSTGPVKQTYTFTAPAAGTYYFRCDVHPDQMNGSFIVK